MSFSTTTGLALKNLCISPRLGATLTDQLNDCYKQLTEYSIIRSFPRVSIVKQTVFISVANNAEYIQSKQKLLSCAKEYFEKIPPTSIIAQHPENGSLVMEITSIEGLLPEQIKYRQNDDSTWLVVDRCGMKMLFASCTGEKHLNGTVLEQSQEAFHQVQNILSSEGMRFSDIIRQWNYIEKMTGFLDRNNSTSQHYQMFNDVRSKFYNQADFSNGFPAATGIGTDFGGISIDIIAAELGPDCRSVAIKSPVQQDAYKYTQEVLAENSCMSDFCRTSPKFERARVLDTPEYKWIFISGTAAIKGQISIPILSAEVQTEMTLQNILSLTSPENLMKHGVGTGQKARLDHLRVYVKYPKDLKQVQETCQQHFPHLPTIYLIADICRPELLVEIEGLAVTT